MGSIYPFRAEPPRLQPRRTYRRKRSTTVLQRSVTLSASCLEVRTTLFIFFALRALRKEHLCKQAKPSFLFWFRFLSRFRKRGSVDALPWSHGAAVHALCVWCAPADRKRAGVGGGAVTRGRRACDCPRDSHEDNRQFTTRPRRHPSVLPWLDG